MNTPRDAGRDSGRDAWPSAKGVWNFSSRLLQDAVDAGKWALRRQAWHLHARLEEAQCLPGHRPNRGPRFINFLQFIPSALAFQIRKREWPCRETCGCDAAVDVWRPVSSQLIAPEDKPKVPGMKAQESPAVVEFKVPLPSLRSL